MAAPGGIQNAIQFLTPAYHLSSKSPRHYKEIAINVQYTEHVVLG
jgi:hypothetical protein